jgi:hypothetical protein
MMCVLKPLVDRDYISSSMTDRKKAVCASEIFINKCYHFVNNAIKDNMLFYKNTLRGLIPLIMLVLSEILRLLLWGVYIREKKIRLIGRIEIKSQTKTTLLIFIVKNTFISPPSS